MLGLPAQQVQQGALPAPDPELAAEMYQEGRAVLREAGFRQYEVSNFARNGALSTHNWTYWQCGQYIGIGPGESPVNHRRDDSGVECHGCVILDHLLTSPSRCFLICKVWPKKCR
uniref:Radical S-adenosyl methionine domain containing 1 n=1 Tax=Molossus molossus TaxID=27622 RepID=A0A7J8D1J7_MOLMO|nr:radical S-adenosyl methionine domain containing 1 [Molossus molossus]